MRAFRPQACYAGGPGEFRYLLYKDVNRHAKLPKVLAEISRCFHCTQRNGGVRSRREPPRSVPCAIVRQHTMPTAACARSPRMAPANLQR